MSIFPHVDQADEYGILAVSESLHPELVKEAYFCGVFPWPHPEWEFIPWFAPNPRAIIPIEHIHISRRMKRILRQKKFVFKINTCFSEVIEACSKSNNRKSRNKNHENDSNQSWITTEMKEIYTKLNNEGLCHSVEAFLDNELAGGLYGVCIGNFFSAESMFYKTSNASKAALYMLAAYLKKNGGTFIDCQDLNPHTESLGGVSVSRQEFMRLHTEAKNNPPLPWQMGELEPELFEIIL
ncbi:MAG TPA: leucyl/phenylalanyl-tRNA--protein transferase [Oligoflexia bacterium]|nr:leucyl/phenylalanyl-tRNA--protein transferase [Oligoflexia bacterium]HMP48426.1 leucyl/phenylalanyl-tRNA--protein transferase [Oligoflexia bacterium]